MVDSLHTLEDVSLPAAASLHLLVIDWRWALPQIAVVFVVTRLLVLMVAATVEVTQPTHPANDGLDLQPIITSLTVWDGRWFISIAESGYHADPFYFNPFTDASGPAFVDYAFYPLYPAVTKAATLLTLGDAPLAGVLRHQPRLRAGAGSPLRVVGPLS